MTSMGMEIDVAKVTSVLLADGWHEVDDGTFTLQEYEFLFWPRGREQGEEPQTVHGSGENGICATGFQFREYQPEDGSVLGRSASWICGPLSAVLAVRVRGGW
jgi:hypothetical protein